jgi:hypothetical protein
LWTGEWDVPFLLNAIAWSSLAVLAGVLLLVSRHAKGTWAATTREMNDIRSARDRAALWQTMSLREHLRHAASDDSRDGLGEPPQSSDDNGDR